MLVTGIELLFAYLENHVKIWLVILCLSRQKLHAKNIFMLIEQLYEIGHSSLTVKGTRSVCKQISFSKMVEGVTVAILVMVERREVSEKQKDLSVKLQIK